MKTVAVAVAMAAEPERGTDAFLAPPDLRHEPQGAAESRLSVCGTVALPARADPCQDPGAWSHLFDRDRIGTDLGLDFDGEDERAMCFCVF